MGRHVEPLTGGLTTDRDPAQLNKGQLSYIRNMVYKQGATSLRVAPGRLAIATAATGTPRGGVYGLRDMQFDNGMHYLVAGVEDMYRYMDINNPGTFSTIISGQATGRNIEAVQFRNRYYLLNGATSQIGSPGTNKVVYLSATSTACAPSIRQHGMLPSQPASVTVATGSLFSESVTGYYEYWTTEVARITQDGQEQTFESAFSEDSKPATVLVPATTHVPVISMPGISNKTSPMKATSWRVYRSPKKDSYDQAKFPVGYMIAELSTGVTSHRDGVATASASGLPTLYLGTLYPGFNAWNNASAMFLNDGNYASASTFDTEVEETYMEAPLSAIAFNVAISGAVRGIEVTIKGYAANASTSPTWLPVLLRLYNGRPTGAWTKTAAKWANITSTSSASPNTITVGSPTDVWVQKGPGFDAVDLGSNFTVSVIPYPTNTVMSAAIDYVKVTVYYGASTLSTVQYPAIVYEEAGVPAQAPRNSTPPSAKTGDAFNDSLVLNDNSNPSLIRYSVPGEPDYFPPTYYLDFETKSNDVVQCIRVVNNRLIVGLDNQLWRVNYLPSERDASFDRGKAIDNISGQYGIVNPMCATTITIEGQSETLAFVSNFGLHTTDGYNIVTRSKNLTWEYSGSLGTPIALLNDTENRCLRVYYRQSTDPDKELCLWASYDRSDIDAEGNFKFSGPVSMANYSGGNYARLETAWNVIKSDGASRFYMGYSSGTAQGGGMVYSEYSDGLGTIPGYTSNYKYKTRRMYLNGIGGEWMVDDLYGYCGTYTGSPLLTYTLEGTKTNLSVASPVTTSKTITLSGQELHRTSPKISVEGLTVACTMTYPLSIDYGQESLVIGSKSLGYEDSGL